jgi:hypothetical protein
VRSVRDIGIYRGENMKGQKKERIKVRMEVGVTFLSV